MSIPDNYSQWESREKQQQAWLDSLPKCDLCGKPIQDEDCYEISGEIICESCLNRHYKKKVEDYIK